MSDVDNKVIDLTPLIRMRSSHKCKHEHVTVSDYAASLTCDECDVEIDPWEYLRRLANSEKYFADRRRRIDQDIEERLQIGNSKLKSLNERISELVDQLNALGNVVVGGVPLHTHVRRARKR
jgi:hypothetical protein